MEALLLQLLPALIATASVLVTEGVKKVAPKIPKALIPLTAVAIATGSGIAAGLPDVQAFGGGLAAIGIREIADQALKALGIGTPK